MHTSDLVIVANRLPIDSARDDEGKIIYRRSPGGLVTALDPILSQGLGAWVGWAGTAFVESEDVVTEFVHNGITVIPVPLTDKEITNYYEGFSNGTLWPLYHDLVEPPQFHRQWWATYEQVNRKFAESAARVANPGATVWVHDYQLQLVPQFLRQLRPDVKIGFFLHIPMPPANLFLQIPSRNAIAEGLLGADLIGFQRHSDAHNFLEIITSLNTHPNGKLGHSITVHDQHNLTVDGRHIAVDTFPISIDARRISDLASTQEMKDKAAQLRHDLGNPKKIILGVDRLDYTKGIDVRLRAVQELLEDNKIHPEDFIFVQIAVPSREKVDSYRRLRDTIELLVSRINGDWSLIRRPTVHYIHKNIPFDVLLTFFIAADVMLVTPFRDGMNLVAKEYIASRSENNGALVLSEFTGAAEAFPSAHLVNPHDIIDVKNAIESALSETDEQEHQRIEPMRNQVLSHDIHEWAKDFLHTLTRTHN